MVTTTCRGWIPNIQAHTRPQRPSPSENNTRQEHPTPGRLPLPQHPSSRPRPISPRATNKASPSLATPHTEAMPSTGQALGPRHRISTPPTPSLQRYPSSTRHTRPRLRTIITVAWGVINPRPASHQYTWSPRVSSHPACNSRRTYQSCTPRRRTRHQPQTAHFPHPYQTSPGFRVLGRVGTGPRLLTEPTRTVSRRIPAQHREGSKLPDLGSKESRRCSPRCSSTRFPTRHHQDTPLVPPSACRRPWHIPLPAQATTIPP